jgi:hypothetical protein
MGGRVSGLTPVRARDLKAGQRVYVTHLKGWYTLASDARRHRVSENVTVLEFVQIRDEYRPADEAMRVRPPRRRLRTDAG